jgi:hypothetical protein
MKNAFYIASTVPEKYLKQEKHGTSIKTISYKHIPGNNKVPSKK